MLTMCSILAKIFSGLFVGQLLHIVPTQDFKGKPQCLHKCVFSLSFPFFISDMVLLVSYRQAERFH